MIPGRIVLAAAVLCGTMLAAPAERKTRNIIFVMADGLRWQEVFLGADETLMDKEHGAVADADAAELRKEYWRETAQARREIVFPFLWRVVAKEGQIYGNRTAGSEAYVTNGLNFSYPGYNETLAGFADPRVKSNDKIPNPNRTVLEWLHGDAAFRGKVAAFGAWDVFPFIFNAPRAGFPVNAGYEPFTISPMTAHLETLNRLKVETYAWKGEPFDSFPFHTALEYLKLRKPRVLYLSLGETDEWAHAGKYAEYLRSARLADQYLRTLWETVQAMPQYRGTTTLIVSVDHGRGPTAADWKSHGEKVPESKYIWMGFLGPDTPALGERKQVPAVTQSQIAATLASLLGKDFGAAVPQAARPIADVVRE